MACGAEGAYGALSRTWFSHSVTFLGSIRTSNIHRTRLVSAPLAAPKAISFCRSMALAYRGLSGWRSISFWYWSNASAGSFLASYSSAILNLA